MTATRAPATAPPAGAAAGPNDGGEASSRNDLLILHVEPPEDRRRNEHVYRTQQPCRALGELGNVNVVSGSLLSPSVHALLPHADVLVMSDLADPDLLPILDTRRRARRLSVYEINRHHLYPPPGIAGPPAHDLVGRSLSPQLARHSDCLQLPTAELDRRFRLVSQRRAVFPSNRWSPPQPVPAGARNVLRVGWGGAVGHAEDLRWIAPILELAARRHPELHVAISGAADLGVLFAGIPSDRFELVPESTSEAFEAFLTGLTIGVSPLLPTTYNRCRSDSKFLEYAANHVLAVCSDLEPYAALRARDLGLLFKTADELGAALERALTDVTGRLDMVARAARFVADERIERTHAPHRLGFYLATIAALGYGASADRERASQTAPAGGATRIFAELGQAPTFPDSRYLAIAEDPVEARLALGLEAAKAGDVVEALRRFEEAAARAPTFHLPRLLAGTVEREPHRALEHLRRAADLAPRSCRAIYEIGVRLHALGDTTGARVAWEQCRQLAPAFGAAETRLAEQADAEGRLEEACRLFEEAALQNSFLAWPVARLAAIAIDGHQLEKAVALLRPSLEQDEELWLTNFLLGRAYLEMNRNHEAHVHLARAEQAPPGSGVDRAALHALLATVELRLGAPAKSRAHLQALRAT